MTENLTDKSLELLTFTLSEQEYSLDIMCVREIRGWTKTTPLPHAPKYMKGVINLRGTVLPVMDLAQRLGLPQRDHSDRNVIIVVKQKDAMTGLLVDAVSDIIAISDSDVQPPPNIATGADADIIKGLTVREERMIRILDLQNIVDQRESEAA